MCATAILPKMKKEERPERESSQLKILPPFVVSRLMNARQPNRSWRMTTVTGRPLRSM